MSVFSKKHRKKLISGIITLVILVLSYFIKIYFESPIIGIPTSRDTLNVISQKPIINSNLSDSARQNITVNQVNQTNSNKGDVKNEFISGNKIINQKTVYINPEPEIRKVTSDDIDKIKKQVSKNYIIELLFSSSDKECYNYGIELSNKLTSIGYSVENSTYGILGSNNYSPRFELSIDNNNHRAKILIFPLRK
ncbi:MAG: hypothetical protein FD143_3245 [Ignavibacteria bacterium]|nr:MAG: hypothetical protein FD143_3245 [Ignavibacteria bacterium]KAF0153466.1 MAG: hypothetical protein FD188_3375 [Ignavibacteria bacterium]